MNAEMFKKLQDFIDDIKGQDEDVPSIEDANDQESFFEDDGCPSQPINKEAKPNLFDELGGIPAPESDNWDDEDENEGKVSSEKIRKNFFENFFQLQGVLPDDDDEIYLE